MKIKKDLSGLDSFIQEVEDEINQGLIDAAHKAVDTQKVRNESSKKTYANHTWNLRNAPGAAVVRNGEIIDLYVPADGEHSEAKNKTEAMLIFGNKPKDGIVVADGMEYASFVSSKGFDVLDTARHVLEREVKENVTTNIKVKWQD
ncbi:hypothetical protein [Bacteroides acidifaciens]|uniref:hypothetical protein n=1 Tax=Bacteroides acidifaciens TaxID=85831 RepID=UPI002632730C|nr:hypothetical protein [Bacteroides acidifaciens]